MNRRIVYAWTDAPRPEMVAWAVTICVVVAAGVNALGSFAGSSGTIRTFLTLLGIVLVGGLWLVRTRCDVSIERDHLLYRRRPVFGPLLNWPWTVRRIARQNISESRLERGPWAESRLTLWLDDGSLLRIGAGFDSFEPFVAAFRAFAGGGGPNRISQDALGDPERNFQDAGNAWRFPLHRMLIAGVIVACGGFMFLEVRQMTDQPSAVIAVIAGLMVTVAGVRFLLQSE